MGSRLCKYFHTTNRVQFQIVYTGFESGIPVTGMVPFSCLDFINTSPMINNTLKLQLYVNGDYSVIVNTANGEYFDRCLCVLRMKLLHMIG